MIEYIVVESNDKRYVDGYNHDISVSFHSSIEEAEEMIQERGGIALKVLPIKIKTTTNKE